MSAPKHMSKHGHDKVHKIEGNWSKKTSNKYKEKHSINDQIRQTEMDQTTINYTPVTPLKRIITWSNRFASFDNTQRVSRKKSLTKTVTPDYEYFIQSKSRGSIFGPMRLLILSAGIPALAYGWTTCTIL